MNSKEYTTNWLIYSTRKISNIRRNINYFFGWIYKCIKWAIFLWNDSDYDYTSIIDVLRFKIQQNRKYIEKSGHFVGSEDTAKEMKIVESYLSRMIENNYCKKDFEWLHERFGIPTIKFQELETLHGIDCYKMVTYHNGKILDGREKELEHWYSTSFFKKEDKMWDSDFEEALRLLKKNIKKWWD